MTDPYTFPARINRRMVGPIPSGPNPYIPGTSEWWLQRLIAQLDLRQQSLEVLDAYYRGSQDTLHLASLAALNSGMADLFQGINANLAKLIVDAPRQRLEVFGFRSVDSTVDDAAWALWQANEGDYVAQIAHTEAMVKRECPVLVEPSPTGPRITAQDPLHCTVETAAGDTRMVRAGIKRWQDDTGRWLYTLYLPERIERWQERRSSSLSDTIRGAMGMAPLRYEPRAMDGGQSWWEPNPLGEVPLVIIPNQPRVDGTHYAEHEAVIPLLDLYNKTLLDMAVTAEFSAFPQRYGIGVEFGEDEAPSTQAGLDAAIATPKARFRAAVDMMITTAAPDAQFGQFTPADLAAYGTALDRITTNIGTITFTPYHLLLNMPSAVPATGEALKAAQVGLVAKVRDHQREKGPAWEHVLQMALRLDGQADRAARLGEVIWRDPETKGEAQHTDALAKLRGSLGLPQEAAWELLPASPVQIARWRRQQEDEQKRLVDLVGEDMASRIMARSLAGGSIPDTTVAPATTPAQEPPQAAPAPPAVQPAQPPSGGA